jgi:hypothetical protein
MEIFLDRTNERRQKMTGEGEEALRIFLFLLAGGHIPTFGAGEGPLSFASALLFSRRWTQKWFYTPTRYAGLFAIVFLLSLCVLIRRLRFGGCYENLLVNYFFARLNRFEEKRNSFVKKF